MTQRFHSPLLRARSAGSPFSAHMQSSRRPSRIFSVIRGALLICLALTRRQNTVRDVAGYNCGMKFRIKPLDVKVAAARQEFAGIADSDIQDACGDPVPRRVPSEAALAVYDELVRQEEAQADLDLNRSE